MCRFAKEDDVAGPRFVELVFYSVFGYAEVQI